jgi:Cu-Zn family superoxide dismutase
MKNTLKAVALGALATTAVLGTIPAASATGADRVRAEGALVRYNTSLVPEGATARVQAVYTGSGSTVVTLHVKGLLPNRAYGSHAHTNACGATGSAAGPHYQYEIDPVTPSTNPAYANPQNEIWLDLHTDEEGNAVAQTVVDWQPHANRRPASVIIHIEHTHTGPNDSGVAGARLACLSVPF